MKTKTCTGKDSCGQVKPLSEFGSAGPKSRAKYGKLGKCKVCTASGKRAKYKLDPQRFIKTNVRSAQKPENILRIKDYKAKHFQENKERYQMLALINSKKPKSKAAKKKWVQNNRQLLRDYRKQYKADNAEKFRGYQNKAYAKNVKVMMKVRLRSRLNLFLRGKLKSVSAVNDLGCSLEFLIETYFPSCETYDPRMTMENRHLWHVDHIIPLESIEDPEDMTQIGPLVHYSNLRPLWAWDNDEKSDRLDWVWKKQSEEFIQKKMVIYTQRHLNKQKKIEARRLKKKKP